MHRLQQRFLNVMPDDFDMRQARTIHRDGIFHALPILGGRIVTDDMDDQVPVWVEMINQRRQHHAQWPDKIGIAGADDMDGFFHFGCAMPWIESWPA